jgi:hypothetical protein
VGYRTATPPERSPEEEELKRLAEEGRRVQSGQAAEARKAAMALQVRQRANMVAQDKARLRKLARREKPARAPLIIGSSILTISGLGGYLFSQSGLHPAVWINLMIWVVVLPSFVPGFFLERRLALLAGMIYEQEENAWASSHDFAIHGLPWDQYDHGSEVKMEVRFRANKPEPTLLADALRGVNSDVLVEIVSLIGRYSSDEDDEVEEAIEEEIFEEELESLEGMEAQRVLSAPGGGIVLRIAHRHRHYGQHWIKTWMHESIDSAFQTIHKAYEIESLRVRD